MTQCGAQSPGRSDVVPCPTSQTSQSLQTATTWPAIRCDSRRWLGLLAAWLLVLSVVFLSVNARAQDAGTMEAFPWAVGDSLGPWTITEVETHPEFIRLRLGQGSQSTHVEISFRGDQTSPWMTKHYRIMPAPGSTSVNPEAMALMVEELTRLEQQPASTKLVQEMDKGDQMGDDFGRWSLFSLVGLFFILVGLLLLFALRAGTLARRWEWSLGVGVVLLVWWVVATVIADPSWIENRWITILQSEAGVSVIRHLYGRGVHALILPDLSIILFGEKGAILRSIVQYNVALTGLSVLGLALVLQPLLERWWMTVLATALYALSPMVVNGALSESAVPLISVLTVGALTVCWVANHPRATRIDRIAALLTLVLWAVVVGSIRHEIATVGAVFILVELSRYGNLRGKLSNALSALWARFEGSSRLGLLLATAGLLALAVVGFNKNYWPLNERIRLLTEPLVPMPESFLSLPVFLAQLMPLGVAVLAVLGLWRSFRLPAATQLIAVPVLYIYGVYVSLGGDDAWRELFRYTAHISLAIFVVVALGIRQFDDWLRKVSRTRAHVVLGWMAMALLLMNGYNKGTQFGYSADPVDNNIFESRLMSYDLQEEVRFLSQALDSYPRCRFLAKMPVLRSGQSKRRPDVYYLMEFGAAVPMTETLLEGDSALGEIERVRRENEGCLLFYYGMDCNLRTGQLCEQEIQGLKAVETKEFEGFQWAPRSIKRANPATTIGLYEVNEGFRARPPKQSGQRLERLPSPPAVSKPPKE